MNIGAGLSAAAGYFQEQEHSQDRDYLSKQRAYQDQIMQAGLSSLGDRTAAASAGLDTLPGQTSNTVKANRIKGAGLDFEEGQQPVTQAITASDNQFKLDSQRKAQLVAGAGLDRDVADIPEREEARVANNAKTFNADHLEKLATLATLIGAHDHQGALDYANKAAPGKKFVGIQAMGEATPATGTAGAIDTRGFDLVEDNGTKTNLPWAALNAAAGMKKTGKYTMHEGRDGNVRVLNENTGEVKTPVAGDPARARAPGVNQHTPAQLQLVHEYMAAPENKGMTFSQAMERVKTSMEKPRHEAILEFAGKDLMSLNDPQGAVAKWTKLYDNIKDASKPAQYTPNPPAPANAALAAKARNLIDAGGPQTVENPVSSSPGASATPVQKRPIIAPVGGARPPATSTDAPSYEGWREATRRLEEVNAAAANMSAGQAEQYRATRVPELEAAVQHQSTYRKY